jgi:uncharacterized coiled-coil protein SlyX
MDSKSHRPTWRNEPVSVNDCAVVRINFEKRITTLEAQFAALAQAITIARDEMTRRLESMNEIRSQLSSQATTFMTKNEFDFAHIGVVKDLKELMSAKDRLDGKASMNSVYVSMGVAIIGLIVSCLGFLAHWIKV